MGYNGYHSCRKPQSSPHFSPDFYISDVQLKILHVIVTNQQPTQVHAFLVPFLITRHYKSNFHAYPSRLPSFKRSLTANNESLPLILIRCS